MHQLQVEIRKSASQAIIFFEDHLKDGSYGNHIQDLACFYKSPMMFILGGKLRCANAMLDYIKDRFMTSQGDFLTNQFLKSIKPEYSEYWAYMNGWIVRAAQKLKREDITEFGFNYLNKFYLPIIGGFLTKKLEVKHNEIDVLSTAHWGLINLEKNNFQTAKKAGDFLCEILNNQSQLDTEFYLRINTDNKLVIDFQKEKIDFYRVKKNEPYQLYFMLGYPCAYLALLYENTKEKKYFEAANTYLQFSLSCHKDVYNSRFSHKLAWASSILYKLTNDKKYFSPIEKIVNYFLELQSSEGMWYLQEDINTAYDQSAEIVCWFLEIAKNVDKNY